MHTLLIICSGVAAVVLLATVFIGRRRSRIAGRASDSARRRAVLEDCGDDAVWEAGRARSIAGEPRGLEPRLGRRMFLKRAVLSVTAFAVAWLASRGRSAAAMSLKPPAQGARNAGPMDTHNDQATHDDISYPHGDNTDHTDNHSDGAGGHFDTMAGVDPHTDNTDHSDFHSDSAGNHNDMTPHNDANGHFDM